MRSVNDLIDSSNPCWPLVQEWIATGSQNVSIARPGRDRQAVLEHLQVSTASTLGAVAYETGGLIVGDGWLRFLGAGSTAIQRNLQTWNQDRSDGFLLVADDAVGGFFALNGGVFDGAPGSVFYWAPDSLEWEPLDIGYTDFLRWSLSPDLNGFYSNLRWDGWQQDVASLSADRSFQFYPYLWAKEGSVNQSSRKAIPTAEVWDVKCALLRQLSGGSS